MLCWYVFITKGGVAVPANSNKDWDSLYTLPQKQF